MVRTRSQTTWDTSHNSLVSTNNSCNPRSGLSEGPTSKPNDYTRKLRKRIRFSDHDDNSQLSSSHLDPTDEGKKYKSQRNIDHSKTSFNPEIWSKLPYEILGKVSTFFPPSQLDRTFLRRNRTLDNIIKHIYLRKNFYYLAACFTLYYQSLKNTSKNFSHFVTAEANSKINIWMQVNSNWRDLYDISMLPYASSSSTTPSASSDTTPNIKQSKNPMLKSLTRYQMLCYEHGFFRIFYHIHYAVRLGIVPIAQHLIENLNVSPNIPRKFKLHGGSTNANIILTPLVIALKEANCEMLRYLLTTDVDVNNFIDKHFGFKLIHFAAIYSSVECYKILLQQKGLRVHATDRRGRTAIELMLYLPRHVPWIVEKFRLILAFEEEMNFNDMLAPMLDRYGDMGLVQRSESQLRSQFWIYLKHTVLKGKCTTESEKFQILELIGSASASS